MATHDQTQIQEQLTHLLKVYPVLSPTLIQGLLGSNIRPTFWKPVLEAMIDEGSISRDEVQAQNAYGQFRSYTCIRLNNGG